MFRYLVKIYLYLYLYCFICLILLIFLVCCLCSSCITLNVSLYVIVIGQVDITRELVSLLSTGPLASYCLFSNDIMLYCMMLINSYVYQLLHSFLAPTMFHAEYRLPLILLLTL